MGFLGIWGSAGDGTVSATEVSGAVDSVLNSIPVFADTTGKTLGSPDNFFIDSIRNFMYTNPASYGSYLASPDTALESYKSWRSGLGQSTDVSRIFYTANPAATKAVWLGSTNSAGSNFLGLTMWDDTAELLALIGMLDADGAGSSWGPYSYSYGPQDILFTRNTSNVSSGLASGLSSQYFLKNGSIVLRDQGSSVLSSIVALKAGASFSSGTAAYFNYEGVRYGDDAVADATKADSAKYTARNKTAGTGGGGDVTVAGGTSVGGVGGEVLLQPGTGTTRGLIRSIGNQQIEAQSSDEIFLRAISSTATGILRQHFESSSPTENFNIVASFIGGSERLSFNRLQGGSGRTLGFVDMDGDWTIGSIAGNAHNIIGSVTFQDNVVLQSSQQALAQKSNVGLGSGTTYDINFNEGNISVLDLQDFSGNVTLTLSNPVAGSSYAVKVIQGSVARNLIWPAAVKWPGGIPPVISVTDNAIDLITMYYDGTNHLATFSQAFA